MDFCRHLLLDGMPQNSSVDISLSLKWDVYGVRHVLGSFKDNKDSKFAAERDMDVDDAGLTL